MEYPSLRAECKKNMFGGRCRSCSIKLPINLGLEIIDDDNDVCLVHQETDGISVSYN